MADTTRRGFLAGSATIAGASAARALPVWAGPRKDDRVLYRDNFDRHEPEGWGRAWFNQRYQRKWWVQDGRALFRHPPAANNVYYRPDPILVLDHDVTEVDVRATVSCNNVSARFGLLARAVGYADYYTAYLGPGNMLRLSRWDHHDEHLITKRRPLVVAGQRYRMRFHVDGSGPVRLRVKVWPASYPEPESWTIDALDQSPAALLGRGAFGIFTQHALDGRGAVVRVGEVVVRSTERPLPTAPTITYALAGPPLEKGPRVVAKAAVPSRISFEYGPEPTLTQQVVRTHSFQASERALTAKTALDTSFYEPGITMYWRAVARRKGVTSYGPIASFVTGAVDGAPVRFAFGACTKWGVSPRRSFYYAALRDPHFFLHQGDLGYVPHRVVDHAPDTYQDHWIRMLMDPNLGVLARESLFAFYRDDADYGRNNADASSLRRFTIRAHSELNANPAGPYFSFRFGDVAVFSLDCRRFSSGRQIAPEARTKIGPLQKQWLFASMSAAVENGAGLLVVASPQAFGSDNSPAAWRRNYSAEWNELMDFFIGLGQPVLIVSGDAHGHRLHEYPQKNLDTNVPRVVEFVSAGTEQNRFTDRLDPDIGVRDAAGSAFGFVDISAESTVAGERTRTITLTAISSIDGRPLWTGTYLAIRDRGIVPLSVV